MPVTAIPPVLARNVIGAWGADGRRWLADLPGLAAAVAQEWGLRIGRPFDLSYHWVAPARRPGGAAAVLKLGVPGSDHLAIEVATLAAFGGHGAVRLLDYDPARGALLLERAVPGTPASALVPRQDEQATAAVLQVLTALHVAPAPDGPLPDLRTQAASFTEHLRTFPGDRPLPRSLVERAARLFDELCASAEHRVVLHGDLHHDNVLQASRAPWLAIDPHGLVGDPGYDLGALAYNPNPEVRDDALLRLVPARVEQLADGSGEPPERVLAWCFVKAVLSEVWNVEDGGPPRSRAVDVALQLLPRL
jgi:streptomycin 6-kinase